MMLVDQVYNQVWNDLKRRYSEDSGFQKELESLLYFYGRKFLNRASNEEQKKYIENHLLDVVKAQYFQGYYIMKSMLMDEETKFPEDVWQLNPGIIRNEIPLLLKNIFHDRPDEWHRTDVGQVVGMKLVQKFNDVFDLVKQIRKDIALYGVYKAFIEDNRYQKKQTEQALLLGNPFDLTFLNPQVYMQAQFVTNEQEIWDMFTWSSHKEGGERVGTIHLSAIPSEEQTHYLLQFSIDETIMMNERYEILQKIINHLPENIQAVLQTRVNHVREMEILVPS